MKLDYVAAVLEDKGEKRSAYMIITDKGQMIFSDITYGAHGSTNGSVYNKNFAGSSASGVAKYIRDYFMRKRREMKSDTSKLELTVRSGSIGDLDRTGLRNYVSGTTYQQKLSAYKMGWMVNEMNRSCDDASRFAKTDAVDDLLPVLVEKVEDMGKTASFDGKASEFLGSNKASKVECGGEPSKGGKKKSTKDEDPAGPPRFVIDGAEKLLRPNGEEYRPRDFNGHTDVAYMRRMRECGIAIRLEGPPGAGKTALAEASFPDCITVNGHGDMTVADFVGTDRPVTVVTQDADGNEVRTQEWRWEDGPLTKAMKNGAVFFVDEATRVPTEVMNILFSVMDGRGMLRIDQRPDEPVVIAQKGFYVLMGYNPKTLGARALDEALVSRFRMMIQVETDFDTAVALKVPSAAVKIARKMKTRDKESQGRGGVGVWVPQMRELLTFRDLVLAGAGEDVALMNLVASCPDEDSVKDLTDTIKDVTGYSPSVPMLGGSV